ncbi:MAG: hypothetical protein MUF23_05825 [Pirellula sp.]|jgi:hypothetical protein|nr:hypothetical protein [Pirellula sp.]
MARDRNLYVWQAYVIVMSFVSLLCIGALCYVLFQSGTNSKMVEDATAKKNEAENRFRQENQKGQLLEMILGARPTNDAEFQTLKGSISGTPELAEIEKKYIADMALLGPNVTEKNYRKLVETLMQTVRERNLQVDAQAKREEDLKAKYDATIKQETEAREAERARADKLAADLERAQVNYAQKEKERQDEITKIQTDRQKLAQRAEKEKRDLLARVDALTKERDELTKVNDALGKKIEQMSGEDFQYPQGKVTEIADGGRIVYLNLGKADGLRPGVRFGVLDDSVGKIGETKPKARLEIVEVNQQTDHLSRARVLPDRRTATILRGDKVYSPVWQPGRKVSIGLVGKMDIDGDGKDDREALKSLIVQNGGEVVVDLQADGRQEGALTVNTRWLVMGEEFKLLGGTLEGANDVAARKRLELEQQAKALGISRIDLDKLMGWLKGSGEEDVVPLGAATRASDFIRREPPPPSKGRVSGLYQSADGRGVPD